MGSTESIVLVVVVRAEVIKKKKEESTANKTAVWLSEARVDGSLGSSLIQHCYTKKMSVVDLPAALTNLPVDPTFHQRLSYLRNIGAPFYSELS